VCWVVVAARVVVCNFHSEMAKFKISLCLDMLIVLSGVIACSKQVLIAAKEKTPGSIVSLCNSVFSSASQGRLDKVSPTHNVGN